MSRVYTLANHLSAPLLIKGLGFRIFQRYQECSWVQCGLGDLNMIN